MLNDDVIRAIRTDRNYSAFMEHVLDEVAELDSVSDLYDKSDEEAGQNAKARFLAIEKIKDIFSPIINFKENAKATQDEIDEEAGKYGLEKPKNK